MIGKVATTYPVLRQYQCPHNSHSNFPRQPSQGIWYVPLRNIYPSSDIHPSINEENEVFCVVGWSDLQENLINYIGSHNKRRMHIHRNEKLIRNAKREWNEMTHAVLQNDISMALCQKTCLIFLIIHFHISKTGLLYIDFHNLK